ncbi:hypothetical protein MMC13_004600 [Lambiella insularis]|nr:hypothetical protein [Lambiella insularis]
MALSTEFFSIKEHVIEGQYIREYPGAVAENQEEALQLHVKQYAPLDANTILPGAVTIIGGHANGFPKELYEPLWDEIYRRSTQFKFSIRSIWIADLAHQGLSSVLNESKLSNDPSWLDHSRDLLHLINHFRAQMPRPIVGIGHSLGGTQLVNLALMHPRLLSTLILLDPAISLAAPPGVGILRQPGERFSVAKASTFRRDLWPSRSAAAASFAKNAFYQRWDPRVLDLWIKYGLRDLPTAVYPDAIEKTNRGDEVPVTLTTSKHQEVWTFLRPCYSSTNRRTNVDADSSFVRKDSPFYRPESIRIFRQLPCLRPSVLYIFGAESNLSLPEDRAGKTEQTGIGAGGSGGKAEGRVADVVFEGVGHLVPMEAVGKSAESGAEWLGRELGRWMKEEEEWKEARRKRDRRDDLVVDAEWVKLMGGGVEKGRVAPKL